MKTPLINGAVAFAAVLSVGCARSQIPDTSATPPITPRAGSALDSCQAAYKKAGEVLATSGAVIDPKIDYGQPGRLILTFDTDEQRSAARDVLESATDLNLKLGVNLFEFRSLPMVKVALPEVTQAAVESLRSRFADAGLLSIYREPVGLKLLNHDSAEYTGVLAVRDNLGITGAGVGLGVIDSGLDELQGDFANTANNVRIVGTAGLTGGTPAPDGYTIMDMTGTNSASASGHGTHTAGSAAGTGAMSGGYQAGMAPGATLLAAAADAGGEVVLYSLEAYDYMLRPEVRLTYNLRVLSNSYGGGDPGFAPYSPDAVAAKRAHDLGVYSVFAAGNAGDPTDDGKVSNMSPQAASPCVISVGATSATAGYYDVNPNDYNPIFVGTYDPTEYPNPKSDTRGHLTDFSSRGKKGDQYDHPDIVAPGFQVVSAYHPEPVTPAIGAQTGPYVNPDHPEWAASYWRESGTSQACPMVAGVVALLVEADPEITWDQLQDALYSTAKPMFDANGRRYETWEAGNGLMNARGAVVKALGLRTSPQYSEVNVDVAELSGSIDAAVADPSGLVGDPMPASSEQTFELPGGALYKSMTVDVSWTNPGDDLDIVVYAPDGTEAGHSGNSPPSYESATIAAPAPGKYRVVVNGYLNAPENYTVTVTAVALRKR